MAGLAAVETETADVVFAGGGGDVWAGHETNKNPSSYGKFP